MNVTLYFRHHHRVANCPVMDVAVPTSVQDLLLSMDVPVACCEARKHGREPPLGL